MNYRGRSSKIDSWLKGILRALIGVFIGVALIAAMVALLVWNEAGVVQVQRALATLSPIEPLGRSLAIWLIRLAGLLGLIGGFTLVGGPLGAFFNIVPGMGAMVRFGTGMFAAAFGVGVFAVTLALVWLLYQPWIAVVILLGGGALIAATLYICVKIGDVRYKSEPLSQPPDAKS